MTQHSDHRHAHAWIANLTGVAGYADGHWLRNAAATFANPLPADGGMRGPTVGVATASDLAQALQAAHAAQPDWAALPLAKRRACLRKAAAVIRRESSTIAQLLIDEVGKSAAEAQAEVDGGAEFLDAFAEWAVWGHHGQLQRGNRPGLGQLTTKAPRGVAALITPWNFPASNVCQKAGAALITGNTVIWRPSPVAPGTALAITAAFAEAGLPPGVFNTLIENSAVLSQQLVAHETVAAVSFTGSTAVGLQIAGAAARRGAAVQCEMGGKNAAVVLADADLARAVQRITQGAFGYAGQKCTAVSRVYVERAVAERFVPALQSAIAALKVSRPEADGCEVGPLIAPGQVTRLLQVIEAARTRGARILTGGARLEGPLAAGNFLAPTLIAVTDRTDPVMYEELFGPVLALAIVEDLDEAIAAVNDSQYGLASAIFSDSFSSVQRFADAVHTGIVKVNEAPPGLSPYSPATGWGLSSTGTGELGEEGIDFFTHKKTLYLAL